MFLCFRTRVAAGAGTRAAVFGIRNTRPVSGGDAVCSIFRGTISAGTGTCALMLRIGIFCPCTVCQTVTGIFGGAVRTGGTGHRAFMLGTGIVRP